MNKKKIVITAVAIAAVLCMVILWKWLNPDEYIVKEDEIALRIKLDLKEDIGLLVYDYTANGHDFGGGVSNADKSLLKHDEVLTSVWNKQELNCHDDKVDLWFRFRIITEYTDPTFANFYPEEITERCNEIAWTADFGKIYDIRISGSKANGYTVTVEPTNNE